ncbi:MAG: DUF4178 domain-containing protein [Actinomycetota bacterium]|nr:DUF4178 domain-containing protein [Actinomycetota bacterium]
MELLILLLLVGAGVAAVVAYVRRRRTEAAEQRRTEAAAPRDPFAEGHGNEDLLYGLKVSDVIGYEARDWVVRGTLRFDDGGYTWAEHLISDARDQRWLSVEDDEGISVALWQRVPPGEVDGQPGDPRVTHAQVDYQLHEEGQAQFRAEGTTGTATSGSSRYVDYHGPGDQRLSFERFGEQWEVSVGHSVLPRSLDVFPRSG